MKPITFVLTLLIVFINCKKDENDYKKSDFKSSGEYLSNLDVQDAIRASKFVVYKGKNAPNIVDEYFTYGMTCFNTSPNLNVMLNDWKSFTLKMHSQTDSDIKFITQFDKGNTQNITYFITGNEKSFTVYQEGDGVISLLSGTLKENKDIEFYYLFVLTNNPPEKAKIGDWWEYKGTLRLIQMPELSEIQEITSRLPYLVQLESGIKSDGGSIVTACGVCYNKIGSPTITDSVISVKPMSWLQVDLTRLTPGTKYYAKFFVTNSEGTTYGNEIQFTTPSITYGTLTDVQGNTYKTVKIGIQTWMAENLRATKLNDNTEIENLKEDTSWQKTTNPAYCWYGNALSYRETYGALYNNYVISTNKICPSGWHVPNEAEWQELFMYTGSPIGKKLLSGEDLFWSDLGSKGYDAVGFSLLPGGYRDSNGDFSGKGKAGFVAEDDNQYVGREIINSGILYTYSKDNSSIKNGFTVRCIKD